MNALVLAPEIAPNISAVPRDPEASEVFLTQIPFLTWNGVLFGYEVFWILTEELLEHGLSWRDVFSESNLTR